MKVKKIVRPDICLSVSYGDDPYALRIIKSGWSSPIRYHVIEEWGDTGESAYVGIFLVEQIKEKFGIDPTIENSSIRKISLENPNDQTLGREVRSIMNDLSKTYE
jgi:hypothetical protein